MRTSEGFVFAGTEAGFRRYVKCYMTYFSINKDRYKYRYDLTTTDINEEMEFNKFALLNKEFTNLLTKKEREAVEYLSYHDKYTDEPQNLNDLLSSAYKKWLVIFFNKSNPIFGKISSEIIGSELECLLINSKTKKLN